MKLLITGICGFVGSTLVRAIRKEHPDWTLVGIDNFSRAGSSLNKNELVRKHGVELHTGDIRLQADIEALPAVDWVVDAAANASVLGGVDGKASSRQLVEHNLLGTINLLEYCKRCSSGFILLSTSRVYSIPPLAGMQVEVETASDPYRNRFRPIRQQTFSNGLSERGISESFSCQPPVSLYGSTKVASEQLVLEYSSIFGFPVWIDRCGVMAGEGQFGHPAQGVFAFWIHSCLEKRPLKYIGFDGNGRQVRDCFHPRDLVPLLKKQIAWGVGSVDTPKIVNVSGGLENSMSLNELTFWCRNRFSDSEFPEPEKSTEKRLFDLPWVVLDNQLSAKEWDWRPQTSIESILEEIASHAEANPYWMDLCK